MRYIYALFFLLCLFGCKRGVISDTTLTDSSVKSEKLGSFGKNLIDTVVFEKFTVIPLETNTNNFIQRIERIIINNDLIYIFDKRLNKVCIYNDKGKQINYIHSVGQGPQEYISATDISIDEETDDLLLLCDKPYKMMRYSSEGDFMEEIKYSEFYLEFSAVDNNIFCVLDDNTSEYEIACSNLRLKMESKGLLSREDINKTCYDGGKYLVKSQNLIYSRRFDPCLYFIRDNSIEKRFEFDFGKYKIPTDIAYEEDCNKLVELCKDRYIFSITNVVESDKYIIFKTNLGICLYEKESNKLSGYRSILNNSLEVGGNVYYPDNANGKSIIMCMQPSDLGYYSEEEIKSNSTLFDLSQKVKDDDNPILIVYEFK